jgi:ankyrin repeat protein
MSLGVRLGQVWIALMALAGAAGAGTESPLVDAVRVGDQAAVRTLLQQHVDVNRPSADGTTALHWAARRDDLKAADLLIGAGAQPDARNRYGMTPLSLACTNGSAPMIDRLLKAGANPNGALPEGETPLMTASRTGKVDAVKTLLARGAEVGTTEGWRGQTALMWAAAEGHAGTVRALIEAGADIRARSNAGFTPLLFGVRNGHLDTVRVLLDANAEVNDFTRDRTSGLVLAIINGHFDVAAELLDRGADPNVADARGSALHALAWLRRPGWPLGTPPQIPSGNLDSLELARKLLQRGANPNVRVAWKEQRRSGFDLGMVVNNPPNIAVGRNYITLIGATPFYLAAKHSDVQLMRLLSESGADPLIPTVQGVTPFMAAAGIGFWPGESPGPNNGVPETDTLEAVKLAWELSRGTDVNATAHFGTTPIEGDGLTLLHRLPLNVHQFDENSPGDMRWGGSTAMHGAAVRGVNAVVQFLVDKGGDLNAKNRLGWTPLMLADGMWIGQTEKAQPQTAAFIRKLLGQTQQKVAADAGR